jgi:hypothetical protein
MKLKFGNIQLNGWVDGYADKKLSGSSCRIYQTLSKANVIGVIIRPYNFERTKHVIRFQRQLNFLHEYYEPSGQIEGDLDFVKSHVDNFLIRMNKLVVFL